ncbi:ATP-binding cassette, subfamily B [Paenibacillus sp. UNCCL117]|uniref:ABC transporter ATP-binding protein n=1 Tax=unclassified Paenibacillus TaxID=185978 RepID=UPI000885401C|nr:MULTISPECIES: ABC transporter ATP-binding protein [unclassified Paenibacillus]SDD78694.1 ATP-binding cassette, subfamily B [Paenibacillus sp. cl123]SFW53026.1 ATP-binding cassette, subfamily B [Paenibacillus sp. UNCCL117]
MEENPKAKTPVLRRLLRYTLLYKYRITAALLVLCLAVGAELAGPYLMKTMIDRHIGSIALPWKHFGAAAGAGLPAEVKRIEFEGDVYVRSDWMNAYLESRSWESNPFSEGADARVVQLGRGMYVLQTPPGEELVWTLEREAEAGGLAVLKGTAQNGSVQELSARKLTTGESARFYQHDIMPAFGLLGIYIALLFTGSLLHFAQSYTLQSTALRMIRRMRIDLMTHIQKMPVRYFDNTPIGQVVSRIANDTEAVRDLFISFMATFVVSLITLLGIYIALFILDVRLALLTLLFLPLFAVVMTVHLKYTKKYVSVMRARLSDMNAMISESIAVMPIIQAFRQEKNRMEEFDALNQDRYINNIRNMRVFSLSSRNFTGLVGALFTACIVWYFGGQSLQSAISFGVFYAFIDYLGRFFQPIIGIFDQLMNAQRAIVSSEKVFQLLDEDTAEAAHAPSEPEEVKRPEGRVVFDKVTFGYKPGEPVLRNISFEASKGETVALVGHTGSGKSSIMNLLLGFYEPTDGHIRIDDRDIREISKQSLRKHMGIVLQDPFLFAGDIKFNVSLYNKNITAEQVRQALADVGAAGFIEQLPGGYDEPVVERGSTLSAGQRQLISFARALAFDPAILILDEATASIDSETEGLIQEALRVVSQGRTTFIIAHRLSTIREADLILVLHRGEIVERGTHEELMQRGGRYYHMYQLQAGGADGTATSAAIQAHG